MKQPLLVNMYLGVNLIVQDEVNRKHYGRQKLRTVYPYRQSHFRRLSPSKSILVPIAQTYYQSLRLPATGYRIMLFIRQSMACNNQHREICKMGGIKKYVLLFIQFMEAEDMPMGSKGEITSISISMKRAIDWLHLLLEKSIGKVSGFQSRTRPIFVVTICHIHGIFACRSTVSKL